MDGRANNGRRENSWTPKQEALVRELMGTGLKAKTIAERLNKHGPYKSRRAVNAKIFKIRAVEAAPPPIRLAGPRWSWPAHIREAVEAQESIS